MAWVNIPDKVLDEALSFQDMNQIRDNLLFLYDFAAAPFIADPFTGTAIPVVDAGGVGLVPSEMRINNGVVFLNNELNADSAEILIYRSDIDEFALVGFVSGPDAPLTVWLVGIREDSTHNFHIYNPVLSLAAITIDNTTNAVTMPRGLSVSCGDPSADFALQSDSPVNFTGAFCINAPITPSQITSDQHDYNPTGLIGAYLLRLSSDAARSITGLFPGFDGRQLCLMNIGSQTITLEHEHIGSTADNRIIGYGGADTAILPSTSRLLLYDGISNRWRVVA